eukprot:COSAG02_NODE_550_length_20437_cov_4.270676_4_plen_126_part_00
MLGDRAVRDRYKNEDCYDDINDECINDWNELIKMYLDMRKGRDYSAKVPCGLGSTGDCAAVSFLDPAVDAQGLMPVINRAETAQPTEGDRECRRSSHPHPLPQLPPHIGPDPARPPTARILSYKR